MQGIDYSFGRPGGAAIAAAGFQFAMRYLPYPGDQGKGLSLPEIADLHGNGIAIGLIWESVAGRAHEGYTAGLSDGVSALGALVDLNVPTDVAVYFTVDFDSSARDYEAIANYLVGAGSAIGHSRVGIYAEFEVIEYLRVNTFLVAPWRWQTYAWSGPSKSPDIHVFQYRNGQTLNGAPVDYDEAIDGNWGQWSPPAKEAEPMALTPDEINEAEQKRMRVRRVAHRLALMAEDVDLEVVDETIMAIDASVFPDGIDLS